MVDFLISYKNNTAKIGKVDNSFKLKSLDLPAGLTTENDSFLATENGSFLVWDSVEDDSLVYRFITVDALPSPEIDTQRILYGD